MEAPKIDTIPVNVSAYVHASVVMWPDEALEFASEWIIDRYEDIDISGTTKGIQWHIRKRTAEDPTSVIVDKGSQGDQ